jgi:hypothetical protein
VVLTDSCEKGGGVRSPGGRCCVEDASVMPRPGAVTLKACGARRCTRSTNKFLLCSGSSFLSDLENTPDNLP